jgi:hypothetical protein
MCNYCILTKEIITKKEKPLINLIKNILGVNILAKEALNISLYYLFTKVH